MNEIYQAIENPDPEEHKRGKISDFFIDSRHRARRGLFTGVKVASDRAISSFESDIRGINPYANFEILDTSGIDFDEQIYRARPRPRRKQSPCSEDLRLHSGIQRYY